MGQLEPSAAERIGELVGVVVEPPRDLPVGGVEPQRQVGREHPRLTPAVALGLGHHVRPSAVLRPPLVGAGRARRELPLVGEEDVEELVVPAGGVVGPGDLDARRDRVVAVPGAVALLPAETLRLERSRLGLGADILQGVGCAVGLAEGVAAGDEGDGLLVVHRHAPERLADVACGLQRVGVAVGALGVDVDQPHLNGSQRVLEVTVTGVALVAEPLGLRPPVDLLVGLPDVLTATAEAEGRQAHLLDGHVAGEHDEVGPRQLLAVLLLDRPQQAAGLVEVAVVGPAVERGEPLLAGARTAAAVVHAVRSGAVPRHADHEGAVVAEVGRPPGLRVREHGRDVGLDLGQVEGVERGGVVEVAAERIRHGGVLREDLDVEARRPPLTVAGACRAHAAARVEGALGRLRLVHLADLGVGLVGLLGLGHGRAFSHRWRLGRRRGSRDGRGSGRRSRGAAGAHAPVGDLGLVDHEAVVVGMP